jgi:hypothetical protein
MRRDIGSTLGLEIHFDMLRDLRCRTLETLVLSSSRQQPMVGPKRFVPRLALQGVESLFRHGLEDRTRVWALN